MSALWSLWAILNTPSKFDNDPYGGLTNQWGHYSGSAALFMLFSAGWFAVFGEMPYRWPVAFGMITFYAVFIEWFKQGWQGRDSVEDTLFFALGPITVAASVEEVAFRGSISTMAVHVYAMAFFIGLAGSLCLAYAFQRLPK